jgi:hypothetical protein
MPHFGEVIKTDDNPWKIVAWIRSVSAVGEWKDVESAARDVLCAAIRRGKNADTEIWNPLWLWSFYLTRLAEGRLRISFLETNSASATKAGACKGMGHRHPVPQKGRR